MLVPVFFFFFVFCIYIRPCRRAAFSSFEDSFDVPVRVVMCAVGREKKSFIVACTGCGAAGHLSPSATYCAPRATMVLAYSSRARQASLCCFVAACLLSRSCVLCYGPTWGGQRQNPVGAPKNVPDADLPDDMEETVRVQLEIESKSDEELGQEELKRVMDNMFKKEQPKSHPIPREEVEQPKSKKDSTPLPKPSTASIKEWLYKEKQREGTRGFLSNTNKRERWYQNTFVQVTISIFVCGYVLLRIVKHLETRSMAYERKYKLKALKKKQYARMRQGRAPGTDSVRSQLPNVVGNGRKIPKIPFKSF